MSATTRKLISAPDGRSSSFAMGTFAIVSLSLVAAILLFSDLVRVIVWLHGKLYTPVSEKVSVTRSD